MVKMTEESRANMLFDIKFIGKYKNDHKYDPSEDNGESLILEVINNVFKADNCYKIH